MKSFIDDLLQQEQWLVGQSQITNPHLRVDNLSNEEISKRLAVIERLIGQAGSPLADLYVFIKFSEHPAVVGNNLIGADAGRFA